MVDEALTVPCEGIGVWEGARVVHADGHVGTVVATGELAGQPGAWAAFGVGVNSVPEPGFHLARDLRLDLTHGPTRLWAQVKLLARASGCTVANGPQWRHVHNHTWGMDGTPHGDHDMFWSATAQGSPPRWLVCEALLPLDPADDTRLGDVRRVDVEALAAVMRQVFTPPQPPPPQPR